MMMWDNKSFIATNRGWRHYSRTVDKTAWLQRERDISPRDLFLSRAKLYLFFMLLTQFCHPFSEKNGPKIPTGKPEPPEPYLLMVMTHVTKQSHCPPPPHHPRGFSRPSSLPTHLPRLLHGFLCLAEEHTWTLPWMPLPSLLPQTQAGQNGPHRHSSLLLYQLREFVCGLFQICHNYSSDTWQKPRQWVFHAKNGELGPIFLL